MFLILQLYPIVSELEQIENKRRRLELEFLDVLNDIETPPTSEDEDPEAPILNHPRMAHILNMLLNMLAVFSTLSRDNAFIKLYYDRQYFKNVSKKMKKMKKMQRRLISKRFLGTKVSCNISLGLNERTLTTGAGHS